MTIKHKHNGKETLLPAYRVEYDERASVLLAFDSAGAQLHSYTGGTAYVTNDAGQTVGIYNLNKK